MLEPSSSLKVLSRLRVPTESDKGYGHILQLIKKLVDMLAAETGLKPNILGLGTPGTLDSATQLLKNSNTTCLNGKPFKQDLEAVLQLPTIITNDANCFALAEAHLGIVPEKLPKAEVVLGIIIGTGVGRCIVVNGKVLSGRQGIGGEWGIISWTNRAVLVMVAGLVVLKQSYLVRLCNNFIPALADSS